MLAEKQWSRTAAVGETGRGQPYFLPMVSAREMPKQGGGPGTDIAGALGPQFEVAGALSSELEITGTLGPDLEMVGMLSLELGHAG